MRILIIEDDREAARYLEKAFAEAGHVADVAGDGEGAVSAPALGMHHALGDALAVLVRQLLEQLVVLHQHRAALAGGQRILIVGDRRTGRGGHADLGHRRLPSVCDGATVERPG